MANPYFKFKKFTVWHDKCAMKVGTDGVLLGVWADVKKTSRILDIGTGTGLIACMLAQRNESAQIDAIDIDAGACLQAMENAQRSPFNKRIHLFHTSLAEYQPERGVVYDLVVSNPPYFIDSLKCPDQQRNTARHTDTLSIIDLLHDSRQLLSPEGRIALILPFDQKSKLEEACQKEDLHLLRETQVIPTPGAAPKRILVELTPLAVPTPTLSQLTIEESRHQYTDEFQSLAREFYLKL